MVKISNRCTKQNDHYCSLSVTSGPLSANINGIMTYTANGVYTYDFQVPNSTGNISVQIYLLTGPAVYQEFYSGISLSGNMTTNCTRSDLNFYSVYNLCNISSITNISGKFITAVQFATSGTIKASTSSDDGSNIFIDDYKYSSALGEDAYSTVFNLDVDASKYYTLYVEWCQKGSGYNFTFSATDMNNNAVQVSYSLPVLISKSPFNTSIVSQVCADGFKSGSEQCDDANTQSGDGCSSSCMIETGWTCSGGTAKSKDICMEICGDGIRFNTNSTYCDDGNIADGDGCSSSCVIESNWQCSGGDSANKDHCSEIIIKAESTMSQAAAGASGSIAILFSFCNASAPTGLWISMNQFQLIMLLLLTKSNIPKSIVSYLSGLKVTTCSFNFIPFKDIPGINKIVSGFESKLTNNKLRYFGIFSGSTFANNFSLICIILISVAIHSLFLLIHKLLKHFVKSKKCVSCLEKTYQFFAFSLYVRIILEANVFLLLSSFSELFEMDTSNFISLCFAFIGGWVCITFISLSLINYSIHKDTKEMDDYIPLKEFFSGIGDKRNARLYPTFFLIRRLIFVAWLIFGKSFINIILISPMIIIQVVYLANLILVRPYRQVRDNIIELTNECFYLVLISLLSYFNETDRWISIVENAYYGIILGNSMIIILILTVSFIISTVIKLKQCCRTKNNIFPEEQQLEESKISDLNTPYPSSLRKSNVTHPYQSSVEHRSDIVFREETKHPTTFDTQSSRVPTPAELYWQRYNPIDGGRLAKN